MATIEQKVAKTVLNTGIEIDIAGERYTVGQPSIATLIMVSSIVSTIPQLKLDKENVLSQSFAISGTCGRQIAETIATLVLGAREIEREKCRSRSFWGTVTAFLGLRRKTVHERLVDTLLYDVTPKELTNLIIRLMQQMQIEDFFGITISLNEINILRPTGEMVTTQSGQ